jgi:hypothetical protein
MSEYETSLANTTKALPQSLQLKKPLPKNADRAKPIAGQAPPKAAARATHQRGEHPTGIAAIDTGGMGACAVGGDEQQCFLSPTQRTALNASVGDELTDAHEAYMTALADLRVAEYVKKVDELPWFMNLLLAAVGTALEAGIHAAVNAVKVPSHAAQIASEAHVSGEPAIPALSLSDKELDTVIKGGVDAAREHTKTPLASAVAEDSQEAHERQQSLAYIDFLRDNSRLVFKKMRQDLRGTMSDASALALYASLQSDFKPIGTYRAAVEAQLRRYIESPLSRLGRRVAWDSRYGGKRVELETRVAWLVVAGEKRLVYVDRAFSALYQSMRDQGIDVQRSGAYDSKSNQLSLRDDATWTAGKTTETRHETQLAPDQLVRYVEPEFVDVAVQKQEQVWLARPETFALDDSTLPPRLVKVTS